MLKDYKMLRSFKVQADYTYQNIMDLIASKNTNRIIHGIVSTCKSNPDVLFVMYKYQSDSILVICGAQPTMFVLPGNNLEKILTSAEYGYIYCWCYQKK